MVARMANPCRTGPGQPGQPAARGCWTTTPPSWSPYWPRVASRQIGR